MSKLSFYVKNWMEFVDIDLLKKQINQRDVYLWNDKQYDNIVSFLKERDIEVKGMVADKQELINKNVYLIINIRYRDEGILSTFYDNDMLENRDYTYISSYKEVSTVQGYYKDSCGNEIISEGRVEGLKIMLEGYNNRLYIGKGFGCDGVCEIKLKGNARLSFGRYLYCRSGKMYFRNSETIFGGDGYLAGNYFISNFEGYINIGEGISVTDGLYICAVENTKLTIGRDCLVAKDVKILSGGAHSLFDLDLKENINIKDNVHVNIGEHVWLGMGCKIIYNTDIGNNCIVGADSLVKGVYPDNCLMAGSIAKVMRTNVDWDHDDYVTYDEYEEMKENSQH